MLWVMQATSSLSLQVPVWSKKGEAVPKRRSGANRRREAQLKREAADHHPTVPARMWTPARRLESLLTAEQEELRTSGRTMSEDDFQFRGGIAPRGECPAEGTRRGEPGWVGRR